MCSGCCACLFLFLTVSSGCFVCFCEFWMVNFGLVRGCVRSGRRILDVCVSVCMLERCVFHVVCVCMHSGG